MDIIVSGNILQYAQKKYICAIGRNGFIANKKEGDGCTPIGKFPLREVYYRPDKLDKPTTIFECFPIDKTMGWCDDAAHPQYNQPVKLPFFASHEKLWRDEDACYDIIVVIGYNDNPIEPAKGSAIFMHIAKENYSPTEGCVALRLEDMLDLLANLQPCELLVLGN